jgi:hypothetical protein
MRPIRSIFADAVVMLISGCAATAQSPPGIDCPASAVVASDQRVTDGDLVTFTSKLTGGNVDRSILKYLWHINRGRIIGGKESPTLVVDTTGVGPAGSVITATIQIAPYPDCEWVTSESVWVRRPGRPTKVDEFWEWFAHNMSSIQYDDKPENAGVLAILTAKLREVDPKLTYAIVPRRVTGYGPRKILFGYSGKRWDKKAVEAFIARAPVLTGWQMLAAEPIP